MPAFSAQRLPRALQCPEGTSLRACQTHTVSPDDTVVGFSEQTPTEPPWGKPEGVFHNSIPGEDSMGLRFRAEFFNIFNHPNFGSPNNDFTSPLFGHSKQTLPSSLGSGGANGGFNRLYQIGGPRSIQ